MKTEVVGIHQPNFFPWLGYFKKIADADTFIFLDHTINNIKEGNWQKRVRILINGDSKWITIPLKSSKISVFQPVNLMEIDLSNKAFKKNQKSIGFNYSKCPFYNDVIPLVNNYFQQSSQYLSERNISFIKEVSRRLGIKTKFVLSSSLSPKEASTNLLIEMVQKCNGTVYLSGDGADGYMENDKFNQNGIKLQKLNFTQPKYHQLNTSEFTSGLSIIDSLMNIGYESTAELLA